MDDAARTDPGERATARLRAFERRQRWTRTAAGLLLGGCAAVAPFAAAPVTGDPGATVGGILGAVLLAGCAVAVWPWEWSRDEQRHHELAAIWAEARAHADTSAPWDRYAAWARADGASVELVLLRWAGSTDHPSPISAEVVRRIGADDIAEAAAAMEALRERAADLETRAREEHLEAISAAERRVQDEALHHVDAAASEYQRQAEARMRRELAAEEAAERRAQAAAVARALRRG